MHPDYVGDVLARIRISEDETFRLRSPERSLLLEFGGDEAPTKFVAALETLDESDITAGSNTEVTIQFLRPELAAPFLLVGAQFRLCYPNRVVGEGTVLRVGEASR